MVGFWNSGELDSNVERCKFPATERCAGYVAGKLRLLCGLIGAAEEAGEVDAALLGSFFTEGASVSLGDGDLAKFVADGNIDLAIKSGGVKAKVRPLTLSPPLTFCRRCSHS